MCRSANLLYLYPRGLATQGLPCWNLWCLFPPAQTCCPALIVNDKGQGEVSRSYEVRLGKAVSVSVSVSVFSVCVSRGGNQKGMQAVNRQCPEGGVVWSRTRRSQVVHGSGLGKKGCNVSLQR